MNFIETKTFAPRKLPVVIIAFCLIAIIAAMFYGSTLVVAANYVIVGIVILFGLLYLSLLKTSITIDNDGIIFQRPLKKAKAIFWEQIRCAQMSWNIHAHTADLSWHIYFDNNSISFQPSYYKRKDLKLIAEAFIVKCNGLITDERILKIAQGKFPWYLF